MLYSTHMNYSVGRICCNLFMMALLGRLNLSDSFSPPLLQRCVYYMFYVVFTLTFLIEGSSRERRLPSMWKRHCCEGNCFVLLQPDCVETSEDLVKHRKSLLDLDHMFVRTFDDTGYSSVRIIYLSHRFMPFPHWHSFGLSPQHFSFFFPRSLSSSHHLPLRCWWGEWERVLSREWEAKKFCAQMGTNFL